MHKSKAVRLTCLCANTGTLEVNAFHNGQRPKSDAIITQTRHARVRASDIKTAEIQSSPPSVHCSQPCRAARRRPLLRRHSLIVRGS